MCHTGRATAQAGGRRLEWRRQRAKLCQWRRHEAAGPARVCRFLTDLLCRGMSCYCYCGGWCGTSCPPPSHPLLAPSLEQDGCVISTSWDSAVHVCLERENNGYARFPVLRSVLQRRAKLPPLDGLEAAAAEACRATAALGVGDALSSIASIHSVRSSKGGHSAHSPRNELGKTGGTQRRHQSLERHTRSHIDGCGWQHRHDQARTRLCGRHHGDAVNALEPVCLCRAGQQRHLSHPHVALRQDHLEGSLRHAAPPTHERGMCAHGTLPMHGYHASPSLPHPLR